MKRKILPLLLAAAGIYSCTQGYKPASHTDSVKTSTSGKGGQGPKPALLQDEKYFDTNYEYADSSGGQLVIQNSFPRSGIRYTDPHGKNYVYAVFWTRVTNHTTHSIELKINFPADSFEIPAASRNYMQLLLPPDTMTIHKAALYNYGLAIKPFLDNNIHQPATITRTILPNQSGGFYVVTLSNHGVSGPLRTGFNLKKQQLFYRINGKEIPAGTIQSKNR